MRRRVVQHDCSAPFRVDVRFDAIADGDSARSELAAMAEGGAELLRVADGEPRAAGAQLARIADLPPALGVERRFLEHDGALGLLLERLHGLALCVEQLD